MLGTTNVNVRRKHNRFMERFVLSHNHKKQKLNSLILICWPAALIFQMVGKLLINCLFLTMFRLLTVYFLVGN